MHFSSTISALGWILSLGIHVGAATWLLDAKQEARRPPPPSVVSFSVVAKAKEVTTLPPPQTPPPPTASPVRSATRVARAAAELPPKETNTKSPPPAGPVDLTGVTLTGGDGAAWSSVTGNGESMVAPIRPAVAATQQPKNETPGDSTSAKPEVPIVPLRDLAAKPAPPPLNNQLLANYPASARRQGLAGTAKVLARVDPDGVIRQARTLSESSTGFGSACRQTLLGSKWSPPRDRSGRAVVTQIHYTCDFRVEGS